MAKTPQDHKTKSDGTVTVQGVTLSITAEDLDDFELLDYLSRINEGDPLAVGPFMHRLVPDRAKFREVMDTLRHPETGRVPSEAVAQFMKELLAALAPS